MTAEGSQHGSAKVSGRRSCILGTAGHIDHGKSALVKALTGTDPDRLEEEQRRGMTIVLGFAQLRLASDKNLPEMVFGIVDVPGHERFLRTMVSGATGIDIGLLAVAADDGVMPQTREHVEILDLLGVDLGLVAITKADVTHEDRLAAVRAQIADLCAATSLRDWPIVVTSAKTGQGLDNLRWRLHDLGAGLPPRKDRALFRMAIDRVFSIHGRGTVVTGSVLCGRVEPGTTLELQPPGASCKVRGVQSHGEVVDDAASGQRAALNLTGVDRGLMERGMELATPRYLTRTRYVDARIRILPRQKQPFPSHHRVRVCMGTSETMAMLVVVDGDLIDPGKEALVQLRFLKPVVASFGQRFILRSESAHDTVGGGRVVRPASVRIRPHSKDSLRALQKAESTDSFERFSEAVRRAGFDSYAPERLSCEAGIEPEEVEGFLERLEREEKLVEVGSRKVHRDRLEEIERRGLSYLRRHHENKPAEPGVSKDRFVGWIEARTAAGLGRAIFSRLERRGAVSVRGPYVADGSFRPALSEEDQALVGQLIREITVAGFDPPEWSKLKTIQPLSKPRSKALADLAKIEPTLVPIGPQKYISAEALERFKRTTHDLGESGRKFRLAEVRDALGLSRRVVQPLLEYLDRVQFTKRVGDERILIGDSREKTKSA